MNLIQPYTLSELDGMNLKGILHPWPVLWLLMYFSQKLQHIGNK